MRAGRRRQSAARSHQTNQTRVLKYDKHVDVYVYFGDDFVVGEQCGEKRHQRRTQRSAATTREI